MTLAILFWFYKDIQVCRDRLQLLRKSNPNIKIFGLYGGEDSFSTDFKENLEYYLDDFFVYQSQENSRWKWINGDIMINDWYSKRGIHLPWDSIAIIQWDTLVFDSLEDQFSGITQDYIYLSGLREITKKIEESWYWTCDKKIERTNFTNFADHVRSAHFYTGNLIGCAFVLAVLPRIFLAKYANISGPILGMIEYRVPTYAKIFNIPIFLKDFGIQRKNLKNTPLYTKKKEISKKFIDSELEKANGWRIFHPYYKLWTTA